MACLTDPLPMKPATLKGGGSYTGNQQFNGTSPNLRNCFPCNKFKPQSGGRINPRTRLWNCSGCVANWLTK